MKNTNSIAWRWANAGRVNPNRNMPRHIKNRCMKTKNKRKHLELSQRAAYYIYGTPLPRTADVWPEARRRTTKNTTAKPACHTHDTSPPGTKGELRHSETGRPAVGQAHPLAWAVLNLWATWGTVKMESKRTEPLRIIKYQINSKESNYLKL